MRRGLIAWSRSELPEAALTARVARTQEAMAAAGLGALLAYTNNTRPAAASWLCGFVPYWSEGVLVLPRAGDPYLVVALSQRVATWIAATSRVARVVSTGRFGREAGRSLAEAGNGGAVGVVDLDALPAGVAGDLRAASAQLVDASALFTGLRARPDPAELGLAARAGAIAHDALAQASAKHRQAARAVAAVEARARESGAEECYVAVAADLARDRRLQRSEGRIKLGASFAIRATVAYKGVWVRATRTVFGDQDGCERARRAAEKFAAAVAQLPNERGLGALPSWLVEGCRLAQPLAPLMGSRVVEPCALAAGALVSVQACVEIDGVPVLLGAPVLVGAAGEAAGLLAPVEYEN